MQFAQSALPFDDIRSLLKVLPESDGDKASLARERNALLTKPMGSLGRLEELAEFLSAWQGRHPPVLDRPTVVVFAGNHGVVRHGVTAFPQEVTQQMVANFRNGGAAINQLCKAFGLGLKVFELALSVPTRDITEQAALEEAECVAAMAFGMEAIAGGADLLCLGEMGIGNTTIAAALCAGLFGGRGADWVGPGTGVDEAGVKRKADVVDKALKLHEARLDDPLEALRRLGGRELAAIAGAVLAARLNRIPVLLDGFVATAAAAVLHRANPSALDHCLAGHCSAEPAHRNLLRRLGKEPILDLGMRLGEASGAALAAAVLKAAVDIHKGMATFADAGVSNRST